MSVGIGLKRCCLECSRPRLELVEIKRGIFDRGVNIHCECSDICHAYAVDEDDIVSVQNCDRDALLALADDLDHAGANVENVACIDQTFHDAARRIREALGEVEK